MRIPTALRAACALMTVLALAACNDAAPAGGGPDAVPVTTTAVGYQPWNDTVRALGTVKARESVTVTAKVSETVEEVHFDSGDVVRAGAPLVTLSGRQQQAALAEAEATASEAEQLYERMSGLAQQQLVARSSFDTQRATRDAARARVAQIRAQLNDRVITAPFSGVLGMRQVSPGALVTPGTAVATLDDVRTVYVDFPVPENTLAQLAVGQELVAASAAWPERRFRGAVTSIDSRIDPATRAVVVRGEFANDDRALRPGMLMQVTLIRPSREALVVPEISVVQVGSSSYVYRVRSDDTVERADVLVGARAGGLAEVVDGLEAGERIVVDGTGKLRAGARIVDRTGEAPRPAPPAEDTVDAAPGAEVPATATPPAAGGSGNAASPIG